PNSGYYLWFAHSFGFENDSDGTYDGGVLQYTNNGGVTWLNVNSLIPANQIVNGYTGTVDSRYGNPLHGQQAFVADSHGYISSRFALDVFQGSNVRFRWMIGLDNAFSDTGWAVDDVIIYNCSAPPAN